MFCPWYGKLSQLGLCSTLQHSYAVWPQSRYDCGGTIVEMGRQIEVVVRAGCGWHQSTSGTSGGHLARSGLKSMVRSLNAQSLWLICRHNVVRLAADSTMPSAPANP